MPGADVIGSHVNATRKALVLAAERAFHDVEKFPERTQFAHLCAACAGAICEEEIVNYLHYQAGRKNAPWPREFVERIVVACKMITKDLASDSDRVLAWRYFATYLRRENAWQSRPRAGGRGAGAQGGPRPRGQR